MKKKPKKTGEQDKPPGYIRPDPQWLVAVIANVKGETMLPAERPPDADAEFDQVSTIHALREAIESDGHQTLFIPADPNLPYAIRDIKIDICFNIAESVTGDAREAQVPALLEMLNIPYTGSRVLSNAISLDKILTKRIWRDVGLPVAPFQVFNLGDERLDPGLHFPLFVKPSQEGTGMGIDAGATVHNEQELRDRVKWVIATYRQPALVEAFLPGREFTVGVMGRAGAQFIGRRPELYAEDGFHRFPIEEIDSQASSTPGVYGRLLKSKDLWESGSAGIYCPAEIHPELEKTIQTLARNAHHAIGALDISRVDVRLDEHGNPCLIEINTLPGLSPDFSDLCLMANAEGLSYRDLILEILYLAASRYNLVKIPVEIVTGSWVT